MADRRFGEQEIRARAVKASDRKALLDLPLPRPHAPTLEERVAQARSGPIHEIRGEDAAVFREIVPRLIALFGEERVASELAITLQRLRACLDHPLPHHAPPRPDYPPYDWRYRLNTLWEEVADIFVRIVRQTHPTQGGGW